MNTRAKVNSLSGAPPKRVLVLAEDEERASLINRGLAEDTVVLEAPDAQICDLFNLVGRLQADVVIIACDAPTPSTFKSLHQVAENNPKPILLFVEQANEMLMEEAIKAGVSAYVVDGLSSNRVRPLIETAMARFKLMTDLKTELRQTKDDLTARKIIERAKGLLMSQHGMTEDAAFASMRDMSQRQSKPLKDIAESIIAVLDLIAK